MTRNRTLQPGRGEPTITLQTCPRPPLGFASLHCADVWYAFQDRHERLLNSMGSSNPLSDEERQRHDRFRFQEDRDLFLLSHSLLRLKLSEYASVEPGDWKFRSTTHGKPEIASPEEFRHLQFNLSHTRGLAACAISRSVAIGIDVENTSRSLSCLELARRFFSPVEIASLEPKNGEELRTAFFEIWTLKEAYIKACGSGLFAEPLQDFSLKLMPEGIRIIFSDCRPDLGVNWSFYSSSPRPDYRLALAAPCLPGSTIQWAVCEAILG
jgi:4'-phosphopantetheinyl transferase